MPRCCIQELCISSVYEALIALSSLDRMTLVVLGLEDLDSLEAMITTK
jgi:hypothetical protein